MVRGEDIYKEDYHRSPGRLERFSAIGQFGIDIIPTTLVTFIRSAGWAAVNWSEMATPPLPGKTGPRSLIRNLLILVAGIALIFVINAAFTPWGFFMGGHFHLYPHWEGWGRMHSNAAGGDYVVYLSFSPKTGRGMGLSNVAGNGLLCTPRGETFSMSVSGDFDKNIGTDTNGRKASFYLYSRNQANRVSAKTRPGLELRGQWVNPDLVLDDHGSIANNFGSDAKLYTGNLPGSAAPGEVVTVTLHEGGKSEFESACAAAKSR